MRLRVVNCRDHQIEGGRPLCGAGRHVEPSPLTCQYCGDRNPIDAAAAPVADATIAGPDRMVVAGPRLWAELHARPWRRDGSPAVERAWLDAFALRLPCGECRRHYRDWLKETPPDLSTADAYFAATWSLHDSINERLGKPRPSLAEARAALRPPG